MRVGHFWPRGQGVYTEYEDNRRVKAGSVWIKPTRKFKLLVHLFTTDPPQKIWLDAPPQDVPLHSGTTVRLICYATGGNPTGTLTWFKVKVRCSGQDIESLPRVTCYLPPSEWKGLGECSETKVVWSRCGPRTGLDADSEWQHGYVPLQCSKWSKEDYLCQN